MQFRTVSSRYPIRASVGVAVLIALACGLCGLVAYQWYRDVDLRLQIAERNKQITGLNEQKHEVEVTGKRVEEELKRVEQLKERLIEQDKTNKVELSRTKRELSETTVKWERATQLSDTYKAAYDKMAADIKAQNPSKMVPRSIWRIRPGAVRLRLTKHSPPKTCSGGTMRARASSLPRPF